MIGMIYKTSFYWIDEKCEKSLSAQWRIYVSMDINDVLYNKTHVRGLFDTDLHEVSWHFATHEAVRPSGF